MVYYLSYDIHANGCFYSHKFEFHRSTSVDQQVLNLFHGDVLNEDNRTRGEHERMVLTLYLPVFCSI